VHGDFSLSLNPSPDRNEQITIFISEKAKSQSCSPIIKTDCFPNTELPLHDPICHFQNYTFWYNTHKYIKNQEIKVPVIPKLHLLFVPMNDLNRSISVTFCLHASL